ncbi:MAG: 1-deoxy-D-xylulose-5-phosphate reductoisomerase, partial [Aeromicrobium sp.]
FDRIEVSVHPSSIVHSMVEFVDGSTMLQASPPDMKLPIALGLAWPERLPGAAKACDWTTSSVWEFFPLDNEAFPAVRLARRAGEFGKTAPAVFNAANEVCVEAFVSGDLDFLGIVDTVEEVVGQHLSDPDVKLAGMSVGSVLAADAWARTRARDLTARKRMENR